MKEILLRRKSSCCICIFRRLSLMNKNFFGKNCIKLFCVMSSRVFQMILTLIDRPKNLLPCLFTITELQRISNNSRAFLLPVCCSFPLTVAIRTHFWSSVKFLDLDWLQSCSLKSAKRHKWKFIFLSAIQYSKLIFAAFYFRVKFSVVCLKFDAAFNFALFLTFFLYITVSFGGTLA